MPIAPVDAPTTDATTPATASSPPAAGFEALLAAELPAASTLPSVSLGQMVNALASGEAPPLPAETPPAADGEAAGDGWGVASAGATAPTSGPASVANGPGAEVIEAGERYLGVPYKWGGTSASTGFDCSGFVQQAFSDIGIRLPRVSVDQSRAGEPVASLDQAQPGDLVFWKATGGRPNHIGIYAGEGQMLVAPRTGDVVRYQDISRTPDAIRRVVA